MGTRMVSQYVNIFMAKLEENLLQNTQSKPLLYLRYIDNIKLLWTHVEEELLQFHKKFNLEDHHINLTMNHSSKEINFLNTTVRFNNNTLYFYRKPIYF